MKILAQFGIFIRIIILNIGGKKANTQIDYQPTLLASFFHRRIRLSYLHKNQVVF